MALVNVIGGFLVVVSGFALYHSQSSVPKLRKYEEKAEKAAEWSTFAEKRLWDTRYTVGAGFVATLLSLLTALITCASTMGSGPYFVVWTALLAGGQRYASQYMRSFWVDKAKLPMMDEYNEAISDSINVSGLLDVLTVGWGAVALLKLVGW
ncbi:hypothetical protein NKR23_g6891 [Pleurostoma richardsiae]|uniref:Uncharacterized protein n=1 Tax=Pleurostoma richardsiae TaxID=41990 RepID=A0AA38VNN4_9PEZI|nr:hypothetical protein NKR23_g6891 [Pleurostoma richardsiae]